MVGMRNIRVGMDIPNKTLRRSPKFVSRVRILNTGAGSLPVIVPDTAFFCIGRAIGVGGQVTSAFDNIGAGSGAYHRSGFAVTPTEVLTAVVANLSNASNPHSDLKRGSVVLLRGGAGGSVFSAGIPGVAGTASIIREGDVVAQGEAGYSGVVQGSTAYYGGSQIGDTGANDTLGMFGVGATSNPAADATGFGGGAVRAGGQGRVRSGGIIILEFYTADPRGISI